MKAFRTLCAASAFIASPMVMASSVPLSDSGLVSLVPGQTAQLNVVNIDPISSSNCSVILSFLDDTGAIIHSSLSTEISAGASALPLKLDVATAISLRAHIDYFPQIESNFEQKDPLTGCYNLLPTLEIIESDPNRPNYGTRVILSDFAGIPTANSKGMKIDVCHNANKKNPHTINVAIESWKAHKGHGDTLGRCAAP